ncbi:MAG: DUF6544 family protein [Bacteroidales bacterium]
MKIIIPISIIMTLSSCSSTKQINELYRQSKSLKNKTFRYEHLKGLPEPVQRYFKYALQDGQSHLSQLRLKHTGQFKTGQGKDWVDIKGEQYFTAQPPGFVWIGKTKAFTARDSYVSNKGNLSVYLLGFLRIVNSKGTTVDQAELLRWLGESVWMPTNLLPGERIQWTAVDENTAKVTFDWQGQSVFYTVHFNQKGQITRLETERYMNEDRLEKWEGRLSDYQEVNGMNVPGTVEASWLLEEGEHTYACFHVQTFEYDVPEIF